MTQVLNKQTFASTVQNNKVVLVDFYADWCGPCQALAPTIDSVSKKFDGKAVVAKVNIDQNPELSQLFQVRNIPALFYFKNGEIVEKQVGLQNDFAISSNITKLLNND